MRVISGTARGRRLKELPGMDTRPAIKAFQREWMAIGYVPMKQKAALQDEYRKAIDALFDLQGAID